MTDPVRRGEASWLLAHAQVSAGRNGDAIGFIRQALAATGLPRVWEARLLALLAIRTGSMTVDCARLSGGAGTIIATAQA